MAERAKIADICTIKAEIQFQHEVKKNFRLIKQKEDFLDFSQQQKEAQAVSIHISRRLILLFFCLATLIISASLSVSVAWAAGGQFTLSGQTTGQGGTTFHITGTGFAPDGTYTLYATLDTKKCTVGDPGILGLLVFTPATVTVSKGSFSQDLTWPMGITQTGKYSLCVANAAAVSATKTLSSNAFTLVAATLDVAPKSVQPGQSVTLIGTDWLPAQQLDVSIGSDSSAPLVEDPNMMPDSTGSFSVTMTIPENTTPSSYTIRAYAVNNQALSVVKERSLTVMQASPTPTPTPTMQPSPTPTPTVAIQPSTTPTAATQLGNPDTSNPIQIGAGSDNNLKSDFCRMAGLGILLILIGTIIFAASTPAELHGRG